MELEEAMILAIRKEWLMQLLTKLILLLERFVAMVMCQSFLIERGYNLMHEALKI